MYMYVRYLSHTIVEIVEVSVHVCSVKNQAQMMVCIYMGHLYGSFEIFIGRLQVLISLRIISINYVTFG